MSRSKKSVIISRIGESISFTLYIHNAPTGIKSKPHREIVFFDSLDLKKGGPLSDSSRFYEQNIKYRLTRHERYVVEYKGYTELYCIFLCQLKGRLNGN